MDIKEMMDILFDQDPDIEELQNGNDHNSCIDLRKRIRSSEPDSEYFAVDVEAKKAAPEMVDPALPASFKSSSVSSNVPINYPNFSRYHIRSPSLDPIASNHHLQPQDSSMHQSQIQASQPSYNKWCHLDTSFPIWNLEKMIHPDPTATYLNVLQYHVGSVINYQDSQKDIKDATDTAKDVRKVNLDGEWIKQLQIPFSVDEIVNSTAKEFSFMMRHRQVTTEQITALKDIRHRGKNKVAATRCRNKKRSELSALEVEILELKERREVLISEKAQIAATKTNLDGELEQLSHEVFTLLRDEKGKPYDPCHYELRFNVDGQVGLVPKLFTALNLGVSHRTSAMPCTNNSLKS